MTREGSPKGSVAARWQPIALWLTFVFGVLLCAIGVLINRPWQQEIWSLTGWRRLLGCAAVFAVVWLVGCWRRAPLAPILIGSLAAGTVVITGPVALAAVGYFALSAWSTGRLLLRQSFAIQSFGNELLSVLLGIAVWQELVGLAAHLPINCGLLYVVLMSVPVAAQFRLLPLAWKSLRNGFHSAMSWTPHVSVGLTAFVLFAHWAVAMRPEVSADGLAMHLVIPATVAEHGRWWYDVERYSWAVMPMAGDWAYTAVYLLGGEWAARLLNFALLTAIVALTGWVVARWVPAPVAVLVAGLFAATPLVHLVTGNLFVENFQAAMLLGALVCLGLTRERADARLFVAAGALLGAALSAKFGSLCYAVPLLFVAASASTALGWRPRLKAGLVFLLLALPPYVTAYFLTGNPVFPFMNSVFRSPYFDSAMSFRDQRFVTPLSWHTPYDATFHTSRFLEAQDGALGYQYLALVPLCLVGMVCGRGLPWLGAASLAVGLTGAALTWIGASNIRYSFAALPMLAVAVGALLNSLRDCHPTLYRGVLGSCIACIVSGTLLLSSSGWWKDFMLNPFDVREKQRYVATSAPGRLLVDYLNARYSDRPVLFLVNGQSAGLRGRVYLNSWHNETFYRRLRAAASTAAVTRLLAEHGIELLVVPGPAHVGELPNPVLRKFVERCTVGEYEVSGYRVASVSQVFSGCEWRE